MKIRIIYAKFYVVRVFFKIKEYWVLGGFICLKRRKKLIIVCTPKTKVYAYQLLQLIGKKDDTGNGVVRCKDGSVEVTV